MSNYGNGNSGGGRKVFDNTNRGTLGKNKKKDKNDPSHEKKPDLSGKLNVEGRDYWVSGWVRESEDGEKFYSLSVQPKEDQPQRRDDRGGSDRRDERRDGGRSEQPSKKRYNDDDDPIPF